MTSVMSYFLFCVTSDTQYFSGSHKDNFSKTVWLEFSSSVGQNMKTLPRRAGKSGRHPPMFLLELRSIRSPWILCRMPQNEKSSCFPLFLGYIKS